MNTNTLIRFDFGNEDRTTDGWVKLDRVYRSPRYGFLRDVFARWYPAQLGHPFDDFQCDANAFEFRIGLAPGRYGFKLYFRDPAVQHGDMAVTLTRVTPQTSEGGGQVLQSHTVRPGMAAPAVLEIPDYHHEGGVLGFLFSSPQGGEVIVNGMEVTASGDGALVPIYPEAPPDVLPPAAQVAALPQPDLAGSLNAICSWLLQQRDADGFMGDFEENKRLWYTAAYPVRVLLAGHRLTGRKDWLDAALKLTDWFVDEQMPEGGFVQSVLGVKPCDLDAAELERIRQSNWMNLADIGSMVAALITACHYATGERRKRYTAAARKYLDKWATPRILPCGGVRNGWLGAQGEAKNIYLVSTAMTALSMALFYGFTGEFPYLDQAERTATFLMEGWGDDGTMQNWNFDTQNPGDRRMPATYFGDTYYVFEALSAVLAMTQNQGLKKSIFGALGKTIFGSQGLLADLADKPWWNLQNIWNNSKSTGSLIVLQDYMHTAKELGVDTEGLARVESAYSLMQKFLSCEEYGHILGLMVEDPTTPYPFGPHSLASWTGCAVATAGFAGISVAQMLQYGVVYPHSFA